VTGLDTNILIRYLVKDDARQAKRAVQFIQEVVQRGELFFLNHIVLCELVWVLEGAYGYSKSEIGDVLQKLLLTKQFEMEDRDAVWAALDTYQKGPADFSDYLIGEKNTNHGCDRTATFDRSLKDHPAFRVL